MRLWVGLCIHTYVFFDNAGKEDLFLFWMCTAGRGTCMAHFYWKQRKEERDNGLDVIHTFDMQTSIPSNQQILYEAHHT